MGSLHACHREGKMRTRGGLRVTQPISPEPVVRTTKSQPELLMRRVAEIPAKEAYRFPVGSEWRSMSWRQTGERVRTIAAGVLSLGLVRQDCAAILCSTRIEWLLVDFGVQCAGCATTTVYPSSTGDECAFILSDSGSRLCFAEDGDQLAKLRAHRGALPELTKVVLIEGKPDPADGDWVITLSELEKRGAEHLAAQPRAVDDAIAGIQPEHLATLIYTSGTTGRPKGVRLVHECWAYACDAMGGLNLVQPDDLQYLWLPLSHSFGKVLVGGQLITGSACAVDGRIPKLIDNLAVVKPTWMAAAPRIFEKVYNKVVQGAREGGPAKLRIFNWAVAVGREGSALRQAGRKPGPVLAVKLRAADRLVFSKLKARFGGRLRFFISGSAPLSRDIAEFFDACGILILEGYGLTESSAASFVNRLYRYRFGTVGFPLPGTEAKLDPADGEVLIKSPGVMRGYHNLPGPTAEVLKDGWLHTGDIGEVDRDGFLRITDRKKDLIKTSGGKYIAPQAIEGKLKVISPYVSQVIVHGDRRNFVTALITLDEESIKKWASENGLSGRSYSEIAKSPEVRTLLQRYIDELNAGLAKFETVKKFAILPRDLTVEEGELTPSLKVKRKSVETKYADVLDQMYTGAITEA